MFGWFQSLIFLSFIFLRLWYPGYRQFSYPEKESQSNDTLLHFVELSNVHISVRSSNAIRSNLAYKVYRDKDNARSRLFC